MDIYCSYHDHDGNRLLVLPMIAITEVKLTQELLCAQVWLVDIVMLIVLLLGLWLWDRQKEEDK